MVVVWGCRVVTYLLHVLLLYDQSQCQFGMGRWQRVQPCRHYCLLGNTPKSKHCSKNCALESSLRIKSCRRFCFVSQPYSSVLSTGECFFLEGIFCFVAKVAIIHRKMQKKWLIIPRKKIQPNLATNQPEIKYKSLHFPPIFLAIK